VRMAPLNRHRSIKPSGYPRTSSYFKSAATGQKARSKKIASTSGGFYRRYCGQRSHTAAGSSPSMANFGFRFVACHTLHSYRYLIGMVDVCARTVVQHLRWGQRQRPSRRNSSSSGPRSWLIDNPFGRWRLKRFDAPFSIPNCQHALEQQ
jgi:hypothetical protein